MRRARLIIPVLCIVVGLGLLGAQPWVDHVTAHGQPRALWHASLPGLDLGVDVWPAAPGWDGYVEVWAYPHDADDVQVLVQLSGAPARPTIAPTFATPAPATAQPRPTPRREPIPGEVST